MTSMQSDCTQSDGSSTCDLSPHYSMADEVATLKRELEALKLQLEQERKKNIPVQRDSSLDVKQELKPGRGSSLGDGSNKSKRRSDKKEAPSSFKESRIYVQHAAVGSRRGKWWLRERQVLSRATADEDGVETLKVRETWVWSGRTVILDKIVRLDEKQEAEPTEEVDQAKPELTSPVKRAEGAAQPTTTAKTSEGASSTAGQEVVDSNTMAELSMPSVPAKADDEPMRRPGDLPTGYESGIIKECALLSVPVIDSVHLGVALRWNTKSIQEFVQVANTEPISDQLPVWISQPRGQITAQSLKSDIIAYLRDVSGGLNSANHLGPNTLQQHWNITKRLAHIEDEGFIQACMARLDVDASLAEVYVVYESPGFGCQPARFEPPPAPKRQVFL
ncbi:hypothetical protein P3T76_012042 [Phytophthora citrophthora]|uniref:Uncharacterized protein n=1 Tax=Phytophthora citrophthora TaxID=4793 RepID=A0AAD9G5Y6_9STRA|nr:hypothetical protein P3T76_012042 [Phytophthora citrophthora]